LVFSNFGIINSEAKNPKYSRLKKRAKLVYNGVAGWVPRYPSAIKLNTKTPIATL
jgi:hypothetical protein